MSLKRKPLFLILTFVIFTFVSIFSIVSRLNSLKSISFYSMYNVDGKSCYKTKEKAASTKYYKYQPCDGVFKLDDWVYEYNKKDSNVIVLHLQGGPEALLDPIVNEVHINTNQKLKKKLVLAKNKKLEEITFETFGKDINFDVAYVKEIWHMKHNLFTNSYKLKFEDAEKEQAEYMDILEKIISQYKKKYDKVIVYGHSYGAFQVNELLKTKGTIADGFVSASGRLEMDDIVVKNFKKQLMMVFDHNDKPIHINLFKKSAMLFYNFIKPANTNLIIHAPVLGQNDYTKEIDPNKLTHKNIVWMNAQSDLQVGFLSQKEQNFAKKYGTLIIYNKKDLRNYEAEAKKAYSDSTFNNIGHDVTTLHSQTKRWIEIFNI